MYFQLLQTWANLNLTLVWRAIRHQNKSRIIPRKSLKVTIILSLISAISRKMLETWHSWQSFFFFPELSAFAPNLSQQSGLTLLLPEHGLRNVSLIFVLIHRHGPLKKHWRDKLSALTNWGKEWKNKYQGFTNLTDQTFVHNIDIHIIISLNQHLIAFHGFLGLGKFTADDCSAEIDRSFWRNKHLESHHTALILSHLPVVGELRVYFFLLFRIKKKGFIFNLQVIKLSKSW